MCLCGVGFLWPSVTLPLLLLTSVKQLSPNVDAYPCTFYLHVKEALLYILMRFNCVCGHKILTRGSAMAFYCNRQNW